MKKLFKQEWKYYLFFLLILTGLLLARNGINYWLQWMGAWGDLDERNEWARYITLQDILYESTNILEYRLLSDVLIQVLAGLLIVKSIFFWQETVRSGREFICTLPVRRIDRMVFHFLMDSLLVIIPVAVYAANMYYQLNGFLVQQEIDIPWLGASIFGVTLTGIAYLLFLLGLINVLESLFASGFVRIIGTVGGIVAGYVIIETAFTLNDRINWMQKLYGYLVLKSAGGCYYLPKPVNNSLDDYGWVHKAVDYVMYYKGEVVTRPDTMPAEYAMYYADDIPTTSSIARILDFSNMDSYIGYVLSYLVLAVLLAVLAAYLVKRQEASKSEFYFKAGRYLLCAEFSGFLTMIMLLNAVAVWHKCLIIAAGIMVFILLNYCMDTDRKKYFNSGKIR